MPVRPTPWRLAHPSTRRLPTRRRACRTAHRAASLAGVAAAFASGLATRSAPCLAQAPSGPVRGGPITVPTRYDAGRWFVRPVTAAGDTLELYTDSGGGFTFVVREALAPGAPLAAAEVLPGGDSLFTTTWAAARVVAPFPAPLGGPAGTPAPPVTTGSRAAFRRLTGAIGGRDGFLGNLWFAGRVWTFDYPTRTLTLLPASTPPAPLGPAPAGGPDAGGRTIPLYFRNPPAGGDAPWHPRVQVLVDGDTLDLLFDTGATAVWTDSARRAVGDGEPAVRAASFIRQGVFDRWHRRHPDWRVVARGDTGLRAADLIEVPTVTVAGLAAGPVWFSTRRDAAFREYMAQFMDRPVDGALGGSALRYFRVTVDYPNRRATFVRPGAGPGTAP